MMHISTHNLESLRTVLAGKVITPDDADYDTARIQWNNDIDRRPAAIARCVSPADIAAALTFAREQALEISVRGGGHAFAGAGVCDGGLMIDLSAMRRVSICAAAGLAKVGGGATVAELDAATQTHGLAVPTGVISHSGVGGLTLGGGMGWLTHKAGLSIDNLVSVDAVLADGRCVHASADEHPDLFWAIRGGGGNFGIVTTFEFRLQPVGPEVHLGLFFWGMDDGEQVLRLARDIVPTLPADAGAQIAIGLNAPPAPFVPQQYHLIPGYLLIVVGFSSAAEHARVVAPIRETLPPLFELVTPIPYIALQRTLDETAPWGLLGYQEVIYLDELTDDAITVIVERMPAKSSPMSFCLLFRLDGAYSAVGDDDTAFGGGRTPRYVINIAGIGPNPELLAADRAWVGSVWNALRPFAQDSGGYVNSMTDDDEDRVRASYGPTKYERLTRIKASYDPDNTFHLNANIKPA
ncbi:MAG TPA: FAD-binding oxidoreductase [Pseudonocardiaceae bacterium]|nr:FAD-binding oxidoreductase [Pseudonocardiaceae bacterium]